MPTIDRRPRRRLRGEQADFASESDALAAADAVRGMPEPKRSQEWRLLLPRMRRWIAESWRAPKGNDPEWIDAAARAYYLDGKFRRQQSPRT
jgi:hypothetical protein